MIWKHLVAVWRNVLSMNRKGDTVDAILEERRAESLRGHERRVRMSYPPSHPFDDEARREHDAMITAAKRMAKFARGGITVAEFESRSRAAGGALRGCLPITTKEMQK